MSVDQIVQLIQSAIQFGTVILFGAMGEILTEKSGNLNLGVPGIMYLGGIAGLAASFFYEFNNPDPSGFVCLVVSLLAAFAASALGGLLYSFLTITLRANQNVTGLTLTIFGGGVANFFGGTLNSMAGGVGQISVAATSAVYRASIHSVTDLMRRASTSPATSTWPPAWAPVSPVSAACTTPWTTSRAPGLTTAPSNPWAGWPWRW